MIHAGERPPSSRTPARPLPSDELTRHFDRHQVPERGRRLVLDLLDGEPVRRVDGGGRSVVVRYASRKMGRVIQAESRNVELVFVEQCEHDPDVLFFLCQPTRLSVRITDAKKRIRSVWTVPDYLVLHREDGFYFVECKPLSELEKSAASSRRFVRKGSGWSWPAAEEAAAEFGLGFRVFTPDTADRFWVRNVRYFSDFVDADCPDPQRATEVTDRVRAVRSIRVHELLADMDADPEIVWWLLANGRVVADLQRELCFNLDTSWVHASHELMLAARHSPRGTASPAFRPDLCSLRLDVGRVVLWDANPVTVVNVGADCITFRDPDGTLVPVPVREFDQLFAQGHLRATEASAVEEIQRQSEALVAGARPKAVAAANRAFRLVQEADRTRRVPKGTTDRSLRRYRGWMREGESRYGSAYLGLLRRRGRTPGTRDLDPAQQALVDHIVRNFSRDRKAGRVLAAFNRLVALCDEVDVDRPSRETLRRELAALEKAKLVGDREGARAGYQHQGPLARGIDGLPPTPDRVFELAHVDHTKLDVELVSTTTSARLVGRPWVTLMIDARSRMPLGLALSFNDPSRVAVAEVLFDAIARFRRAPDSVCVDQGAEFKSVDFEAALGHLQMGKQERPATKPRFGAVIERMFGITNTQFVHELSGNTKLLRRVRTLSSSHHPAKEAVWTLPLLYEALEKWLFEVYPGLRHGSLGASPREVFEQGLYRCGERSNRYVCADSALRILLAVTPDGGTRKVDPVRGIDVGLLRYWHQDFARGDVGGSAVRVKVDPFDCAVAFAWVRGRWVTCSLADGAADLGGRSWKQIALAVKELREQHRAGAQARDVNASTLGRFLRELDAKGELARQMLRDAEARAVSSPEPSPLPVPTPNLRLVKTDAPPPSPTAVSSSETSASSCSAVVDADDPEDLLAEVSPCDVFD